MATIFSKIANNEIPAYKVAEDDKFLAFLDISPITKGHTLVIPKKEIDYIFDLDDDLYSELHLFAKRVATGIKKAVNCKKVGVLVLGLEVPHAHLHLIPMQSESDVLNFLNTMKLESSEFEEIRNKIAKEIIL